MWPRAAGVRRSWCSADTFVGGIEAGRWFGSTKTILVTRNPGDASEERKGFAEIIQVRSFSSQRLAQLRSAVLVALTRGLISFNDRLCCVGGIAGSNQFDTVVVVDVEREFQTLLTGRADLLPADVKPEVLERVLAVAMDFGSRGPGRPSGGWLVCRGDTEKVEKLIKPLVLNPFYGYKEEDRNILSPSWMKPSRNSPPSTGAFIIRGDGVVESAGSLIQAADYDHALPSGLGSRHAAAAAISVATQCISIVISSSTGQGRSLPPRGDAAADRAEAERELSMVFCFEERSREPTGETPVPRGMGVPPMSEETRSKQKTVGS